MHELEMEKLTKEMDSIHRLIILATKRAKQLSKGALPLVDKVSPNLGIVALEEYAQGKLEWGTRAEVDAHRAEKAEALAEMRAEAAEEAAAEEASQELADIEDIDDEEYDEDEEDEDEE